MHILYGCPREAYTPMKLFYKVTEDLDDAFGFVQNENETFFWI